MLSATKDADVFRQLKAILKKNRKARSSRHRFRGSLWVAVMPGRSVPNLDTFERVVACDLSTSGIALLAEHFMRGEKIAIRFGPPLGRVVLAARVVYQSRLADSGPRSVKVGCEFLRRI